MAERVDTEATADQTAKRALAIVLMQEIIPLLDTLGEDIAAGHLQMAIDTVMSRVASLRTEGSC